MTTRKERTKLYNEYIQNQFDKERNILYSKLINCNYQYYNQYENRYFITGQIHYLDTHTDSFFLQYYRKYMAAYKIQQFWKKWILNSHTKIGSQHFNQEYEKLYYHNK